MQATQSLMTETIKKKSEKILFSQDPGIEIKITQDPVELSEAKKLRLQYLANNQTRPFIKNNFQNNTLGSKQLIEQQQIIFHDGYDSYAEHLIIIDKSHDKVIAFVRLIDAYTAYKIGGFYSETRFNINKLFDVQKFHMEISRLVVDLEYNNRETAALIWSGLMQYAQDKGIDAIIGSLSLALTQGKEDSILLNCLKKNFISERQYRVYPYQLLPDAKCSASISNKQKNPIIDYFFEQGVKLCGDAYWNREFNTAELFIHYEINNAPLVPECILQNEVSLGVLYE